MGSSSLLDQPLVVPADRCESLRIGSDHVLLRVTAAGAVQVVEYTSDDRIGPPQHSHPWDEIEYVIDGAVEFYVNGAWHRAQAGAVQVLPAGAAHSVRVPSGTARVLMVTIGAPYDGFARDLAGLTTPPDGDSVVDVAARHGVRLA
jgi:quercetin dioxygenase-like cupin family protein